MPNLHDWNLTPAQAVQIQKNLRSQVKIEAPDRKIELIAGCDISFDKWSDTIHAGIVVMRLSDLETLESTGITTQATFPYVPGLLSFREMPALLEVWEKLQTKPDCLVMDGQGLAHPRRMGIACHAGLWLDLPALGCAKSVLIGTFDEPEKSRGSWSPMLHKSETVGAALRTKNNINPVYVSPGHLMYLPTAIALMLQCDGGYRIPEATRRAHLFVNGLREAAKNSS